MNEQRITVVVPTCNRPELLARCLTSIMGGDALPIGWSFEVIVTHDGQLEAGSPLRDRFPTIQWVRGPDLGPAANRNNGVRYGSGSWVAFTDDDCVPDRRWLVSFVAGIEAGIELYEGKTTCKAGIRGFHWDAPINLAGGTLPSCNFMITRRLFDEIGGFDENFLKDAIMEDVDFRSRVWDRGRRWKFVDQASVDHPPRLRVTGRRLGARWENTVYYWAKRRGGQPYGENLPIFVAKVRLVEMFHRHRVRDYPAALASLAAEWWYVRLHVRGWERKYSGIAQAVTSESGGRP